MFGMPFVDPACLDVYLLDQGWVSHSLRKDCFKTLMAKFVSKHEHFARLNELIDVLYVELQNIFKKHMGTYKSVDDRSVASYLFITAPCYNHLDRSHRMVSKLFKNVYLTQPNMEVFSYKLNKNCDCAVMDASELNDILVEFETLLKAFEDDISTAANGLHKVLDRLFKIDDLVEQFPDLMSLVVKAKTAPILNDELKAMADKFK
jgi:hypothetical protein